MNIVARRRLQAPGFRLQATCHPERRESGAQQPIRGVEKPPTSIPALWDTLVRGHQLMLAVLHEIFDESAYARFLARTQLTPSRNSYAAFRKEHDQTKACRPRCC